MTTTSNRREFLGISAAALAAGLLPQGVFAQEAKAGGTLVQIEVVDPPVLSGFINTSVTNITGKHTEGLLTFDFDFNPQPLLATAWEVSEDGLQYTFTLRPDVKFHDGTPFTAADVVFSIQTIKELHPRGRITFGGLTEIAALDDLTVRLTFANPVPYLLPALASSETPIVPRHLYEGTDIAANPHHAQPVGTGPYRFVEWVRGSHVLFEKNPDYWDAGKPLLDQVIVRFIADPAGRAIALETDEAQLAGSRPIPLSELARFESLPHIGIERRGYGYWNGLFRMEFNLDNPQLQDKRLRQAFAHAIDKDFIHQRVNYGYGEVLHSPIVPGLAAFHNPGVKVYDHNPARAEELLDEAGFPRGSDGVRLRLFLDPLGGSDLHLRGAEYIQQALAAVGVELTLRTADFATHVKRIYTDRDWDVTYSAMANLFDPTVGVQRLFWSKNFRPGIPFTNGPNYSNPEVDAVLEAAAIETDPAVRRDLFFKFQDLIVEDLPEIAIVTSPDLTIYNRRLRDHTRGVEGIGDGQVAAWFEA